MSLLCAPRNTGRWEAGFGGAGRAFRSRLGSTTCRFGLKLWLCKAESRGADDSSSSGGGTGERVTYYTYCDPFCFERFVRWGFLWGCLCTPAKTLPRTGSAAKHGADTGLLPLCSRVCVLGVFLLSGCSHPPLSWAMESWLNAWLKAVSSAVWPS